MSHRPKFSPEEVEVLIDMLEEPHRRWYVAGWLLGLLQKGKLTEEQQDRAVAVLGVKPVYREVLSHLLNSWGSRYPTQDPRTVKVSTSGEPIAPADEPEPLWACQGYLFDSFEAAEGFKTFSEWMSRKRRETTDGRKSRDRKRKRRT